MDRLHKASISGGFINNRTAMELSGKQGKRIHPEKKGIRVLGIAESFTKNSPFSVLCGVVLRRDMLVDGVVLGKASVGGDDATEQIISMVLRLSRNDVNCIMINGLIISLYNIISGEAILDSTGIPVIGVTYEDSPGIEGRFFANFDETEAIRRVEAYRKLGNREILTLRNGMEVYIRRWGITSVQSYQLLNSFVLQGKIPEPLRIAKLISRVARTEMSQ
jgi:uncharacterized protein